MAKTDWLALARTAFDTSTNYVDNNFRKNWEESLLMFQNQHPRDSKYRSDKFRHRSKIFRPKIRSAIRRNEAAAAAAFFSNMDCVSVTAENQDDPRSAAAAAVQLHLLNYRLQKSIPWFQTVIGAFQDAQTVGVVCSYQYWKYKQRLAKRAVPMVGPDGMGVYDQDGNPVMHEIDDKEILEDKPCVELIPVENIRIDPGSNWVTPIESSPYVIYMIPMYVRDIKAMSRLVDDKTGQPKWKTVTNDELLAANSNSYDSTRQTREFRREDSQAVQTSITDFTIVWVHENFIRMDDDDYVYWTLGTTKLLTDPVPLKEVYFHKMRPIVMGCAILETHKIMSSSIPQLGSGLQREANEIVNQRLDNVKLVLNKRWFVRAGVDIDTASLQRNVPGGTTMVTDVDRDVKEVNWPDVTSSSYQEQDRINVDLDELIGNFSVSSVQTNRKLNETVGGMGLIASGANQLTEYLIKTFAETWVEKVLYHLVKLEAAYETDEVVLALAGKNAQLFQKYGIDKVTDDLLQHDLTIKVNVGTGATDPQKKLQQFVVGVRTFAEVSTLAAQAAQLGAPKLNLQEIGKEIFGLTGYQDGRRFLEDGEQQNPQVQQMQQQMQAMMQQAQQEMQALQQQLQQAKMQEQAKLQELGLKREISMDEMALKTRQLDQVHQLAMMKLQDEHDMKVAQMLDELKLKQDQAHLEADTKLKVARISCDASTQAQMHKTATQAQVDTQAQEAQLEADQEAQESQQEAAQEQSEPEDAALKKMLDQLTKQVEKLNEQINAPKVFKTDKSGRITSVNGKKVIYGKDGIPERIE